jgi:REP element-mobilizing transposase RayT
MATTFTNLLYHVIFSTKHREPMIAADWQDELYGYIGGIVRNRRGILLAAGGIPDHVHLLVKLPADLALSDLVRGVKAISSKWRHDSGHPAFAWQTGYGGFSVSQSMTETVSTYIHRQPDHRRARSFQEEFVDFLRKHGVEYDDRYLWD